jgi:hypothetical protein
MKGKSGTFKTTLVTHFPTSHVWRDMRDIPLTQLEDASINLQRPSLLKAVTTKQENLASQ